MVKRLPSETDTTDSHGNRSAYLMCLSWIEVAALRFRQRSHGPIVDQEDIDQEERRFERRLQPQERQRPGILVRSRDGNMAGAIEIKNLVKDYKLGDVPVHVLKGISFDSFQLFRSHVLQRSHGDWNWGGTGRDALSQRWWGRGSTKRRVSASEGWMLAVALLQPHLNHLQTALRTPSASDWVNEITTWTLHIQRSGECIGLAFAALVRNLILKDNDKTHWRFRRLYGLNLDSQTWSVGGNVRLTNSVRNAKSQAVGTIAPLSP